LSVIRIKSGWRLRCTEDGMGMGRVGVDERELDHARRDLVAYGVRMLEDGLAVGTAGNLSVRVGDVVAISPSGILYREIAPEDVCVVSLDGENSPATPPCPRSGPCTRASTAVPTLALLCTRTPLSRGSLALTVGTSRRSLRDRRSRGLGASG